MERRQVEIELIAIGQAVNTLCKGENASIRTDPNPLIYITSRCRQTDTSVRFSFIVGISSQLRFLLNCSQLRR